ncbi:MAG TPA: FprA family A-type flavoprotein [Candidatus Coproplasma stercorigallinarum]|nr:FprA family A-type flavoprotein [Candidatus Coproplasma stercorigallinarum]
MFKVENDIFYAGVNDHSIDLFEGMYKVPDGVSYNSYVIVDEKIAVLDTADAHFGKEWLYNVREALGGRQPDYLVIHHMEPDHSANIQNFLKEYPNVQVVGNTKTFTMIKEYFGFDVNNSYKVEEGSILNLGRHSLRFVMAPLVHWPEVMVSYDELSGIVFSADAFGKFGALDVNQPWDDEARRYYIGIVGKYGVQVQNLLKKLSALSIKKICPLHGPVLEGDLSHYINLYDAWSSYRPEKDAVMVAYASVYGHTKAVAETLADMLKKAGKEVIIADLAREDRAKCVADAFMCSKLVLASVTYNAEIFPCMREFLDCLAERNFRSRTVGLIENGTWAPVSAKLMRDRLSSCKDINFISQTVKVRAAFAEENVPELEALANELLK